MTPGKGAALARSAGTDAEKAMLAALQVRYPDSPEEEDFGPYNDAFADAMTRSDLPVFLKTKS